MLDVGILNILFDKNFPRHRCSAAIFAFATVVTLGLPLLERDGLGDRLKIGGAAARGIARPPSRRAERQARLAAGSSPPSYMKATLDRFKLANMLEVRGQPRTSWPRPVIAARRR